MGSPKRDSTLKVTSSSEGDAPRRTIGEIAREKRLRDDPMADVIGPLFVTCKRCGNRIKLSPKSLYDPFHWLKHRERCLKKPAGGIIRATKGLSRELNTLEKDSPTSSSNTDTDNLTPPPLTPNDDKQGSPVVFKEDSSSPVPEEAIIHTPTKIADLDQGPWQAWSWSDLRPPAWLINANTSIEDDGDDYDEPPRVTIIERDSTPTLSFHAGLRTQDLS